MATQLIGGILNQIFGPRLVVGTSLGLTAVGTACVPLAAELASFWAVFFVRVFLGALSVRNLFNNSLGANGIVDVIRLFCFVFWF